MARAIVTLPAQVWRGEIIEIKTLAAHPRETGFGRTPIGELIPRDIIRRFVCTYHGTEVLRDHLHPAVAANPLIAFTTVTTESGTIAFQWVGDNGSSVTATASIRVEGASVRVR